MISDTTNGRLPNFAVVTPTQANSQHNNDSMTVGDNWLGQVLNSIGRVRVVVNAGFPDVGRLRLLLRPRFQPAGFGIGSR